MFGPYKSILLIMLNLVIKRHKSILKLLNVVEFVDTRKLNFSLEISFNDYYLSNTKDIFCDIAYFLYICMYIVYIDF